MSEFDDLDEELSGVGGVNESTPGVHGQQMSPLGRKGNDRSSRKAPRTSPPAESSSRSRCTAHAPAGTTCKICGKVHPRAEGRGVRIHVPSRELDTAKTDFKKKKEKSR